MYHYRSPYPARNQRFIGFGFGLPFLGGLVGGLFGGLLGSALFYPQPFYGYPPPFNGNQFYGNQFYGNKFYGYPGFGSPGFY
ncbi:hypothetical protein J2Y03_004114 [Neobacillus niacini]|uniref:hypothetical protein n=1 Tax=Neobacillus niacini TaxID=86668 RepID=UPI002866F182|nr:hypothetical protein [Neobacillus niacini]MDR7079057.1 hypothetical protein [Neobacillus niacini]